MVTNGDKKGQKQADTQKISCKLLENKPQINDVITFKFLCDCGNEYKHRQGLWRHKKKCISSNNTNQNCRNNRNEG